MWQKHAGFVAEVYSVLSISYKGRQWPVLLHGCSTCLSRSAVCSLALDSDIRDTVRLWVSLSTLPPPGLISEHSMSQPGTCTWPGRKSGVRHTPHAAATTEEGAVPSGEHRRSQQQPYTMGTKQVDCFGAVAASSVRLRWSRERVGQGVLFHVHCLHKQQILQHR